MNIVLLGSPGSGKSVLGKTLESKHGLLHISTGDLLRKNAVDLSNGNLVADDLVFDMLAKHIALTPANGYILDGIPRTLKQAMELDKRMDIDCAILLKVTEETVFKRLLNRLVCTKCGSIQTNKDLQNQTCNLCGAPLKKRDDDEYSTIKHRFEVFTDHNEPLKQYYSVQNKLKIVEADGAPDEVLTSVENAIKEVGK